MSESLQKLFYTNKEEYKKEYERRFNSDDTIHIDFMIGEQSAFLYKSSRIYELIISIQRTDKKVNKLCQMLPPIALEQFTMRCLVDEIILTNDIEGVNSTRKEINYILQELPEKNIKKLFVGLVKKYLLLIEQLDIPVKTCGDIRKIYDDIFYDEIKITDPKDLPDGEIFRKNGVGVYSPTGKEIHHGVEPESKIISCMEKALDFLNDESIDAIIRIAIFHYLFGYIHPFYDGNGRTIRFISSYLLSLELNYLISYRISYTIKENIKKYYDSFKICNHYNNKGDLTPFVEMFLEIVDISEQQLLDALSERQDKLKHYRSLIQKLPHSTDKEMYVLYDYLIQAALFSEKGISTEELENLLNKSYNTVKERLSKIPSSILAKNRQGKKPLYLLDLEEIDRVYAE